MAGKPGARRKRRTPQYKSGQKARKIVSRFTRCGAGAAVFLLVTAALLVTLSETLGGPLPTWRELYGHLGLSRMDGIPREARDATTKLHFIDVGQASATLIESDGAFCLIDAGLQETAGDLVEYLRDAGVTQLDLLVMTHPHSDHIGGMVAVLEAFEVQQVLLPDLSKAPPVSTYVALRTLELLDLQGVPDRTARVGDTYAIGEGVLTILDDGIASEDYNDISVVTLFEAPGLRFLGCGDAERKQMERMLENGLVPQVDVYAASHHGSADANRSAWVASLAPRFVAVSCGAGNSYGHPHRDALRSFESVGAQVLRTDEQGNLIAYLDELGQLKMTAARGSTVSFPAESAQRAA